MKHFKNFILVISILIFTIPSTSAQKKVIRKATYSDESKPLLLMKVNPNNDYEEWEDGIVKNKFKPTIVPDPETTGNPVIQESFGNKTMEAIIQNFDGIKNSDNGGSVAPPDTDGDVGILHYVQSVNNKMKVYDKFGNPIYGPVPNSIIWDGFTGPWTGTNDGDPVVLYDENANRWLISQFAVNTGDGSQWELIAISTTGDPTGTYYRYAFEFDDMPDYPHFGIWPDAYYMSINRFPVNPNGGYGHGAVAFERDLMIDGDPNARIVLFELGPDEAWSQLPADCDGNFPPLGTPNYFISITDDNTYWPTDGLKIYEFHVDWDDPTNSTFTNSLLLDVAAFNSTFSQGIEQPNNQNLATLSDRLMYRVQYKNFGGHESMVLNHTVNTGSDHAGIRWYELRRTTGDWQVHQQGTYAPDTDNRWMASIAMNDFGDIGLGYSVSSDATYPSIRVTGRSEGDPLGVMTYNEMSIYEGIEAQNNIDRWGDYSMMSVDPTDNSTFWYTQEYSMGDWNWETKIASFQLQNMGNPSSISAQALTNDEIQIAWEKNTQQNEVLLAWSDSYQFGIPADGTAYSIGDVLPGGGHVIYAGDLTEFLHQGLSEQTEYYYKIWSYDESNIYSPGIFTLEKTLCAPNIDFPFVESFEEGIFEECWYQDLSSFMWEVVDEDDNSQYPDTAYEGNYFMRLEDYTVPSDRKKIAFPPMDITGFDDPYLVFWHMQAETGFPLNSNDELRVYYRTSFDGQWYLLEEYTMPISEWTYRAISLPESSETYHLAFEGDAKAGHGVCIDHVEITENPTKIAETSSSSMAKVYPNPSENGLFTLYFNAKDEYALTITDITGKVVYKNQIPGNQKSVPLDLSGYANGIYNLEIIAGNLSIIEQMVIGQ